MAKVKDRLIFETKKIDAVAQRKSNKEQKLRAKESTANRIAEKAKRKRDHFQQVDEWANSAASNRSNLDDNDRGNRANKKGHDKKRVIADKKYGHGGKRGRFKQNDLKSLNDMSGHNPRGNFPEGMKKTSRGSSASASGGNRKGKRARDASRTRR
jgi:rRNA-processing protein EBP2